MNQPAPTAMAPGPLPPRIWTIATIAAIPVLLTYLWLVVYAYPTSDDWAFATSGRDHGVLASTAGYWSGNGGRWLTALLLYSLGSYSFLPSAYPLLIAVTFAVFIAANWLLTGCLGVVGHQRRMLCTVIITVVQITALPVLDVGDLGPHVATPETLYWVDGAWPYAAAYPLLTLAAWLCVGTTPRRLAWTGCIGIGIAVGGLSEMAGILGIVLGTALGLTGNRRGWILAAAAAAGFGIAAASPGNLKRLALLREAVDHSAGIGRLPSAMATAATFTLAHLRDWLLNPAIAAITVTLCWLGTGLPSLAEHRIRRFVFAVLAVPAGIWALAVPTLTLVGFLEARHEGLVSLAAVGGILTLAVLAGRTWPTAVEQRAFWPAAALWILAGALYRLALPSPVSPLGDWAGYVLFAAILLACAWWRRPSVLLSGALAATLLGQPAWWQAVSDACGKAPILAREQAMRDRAVIELVAGGTTDIALPWLGEAGHLPRTLRLYEVQLGWIGDSYAGYFGIARYRFSDRITRPLPWIHKKRAAPPAELPPPTATTAP